MTRALLLSLAFLYGASGAWAQSMAQANSTAAGSRSASHNPDLDAAKRDAGRVFDGLAMDGAVSPPPVMVPVTSERPVSADLIVGTPGRDSIKDEPKNPLKADGTPKEARSSGGVWWTLGGAAAGAGIGFLVGGPIGAAIGALALGLLAFFLRP